MDTAQILIDLRAQRDRINNAITALEALDGTAISPTGPVTKPAELAAVKTADVAPVAPPTAKGAWSPMSAETKQKLAVAAKARWAAKAKTTKSNANAKQVATSKSAPSKGAKRVVSPEARQRMAEAQQKRWAKKKRAVKAAAKKTAAPSATKKAVTDAAKA